MEKIKVEHVLVLLPVYNDEDRIITAIESVLKQVDVSWKLVILDNNSTDSTYELLSKFSNHKNIHIYRNKVTISPAQNWLRIFEIAKYRFDFDYVCYLASDDFWIENNYLNKLIARLKMKSSRMKFVSPAFVYNDRKNGVIKYIFKPKVVNYSRFTNIFVLMLNWRYVNLIYGLYSKDLFEKLMSDKLSQFCDYHGCDWYWVYNLMRSSLIEIESNVRYSKDTNSRYTTIEVQESNTFDFVKEWLWFRKHLILELHRFTLDRMLDFIIIFSWAILFFVISIVKLAYFKFISKFKILKDKFSANSNDTPYSN